MRAWLMGAALLLPAAAAAHHSIAGVYDSARTTTEWPPRSGRRIEIPEVDRVAFFTADDGKRVINVAQAELVDRLVRALTIA